MTLLSIAIGQDVIDNVKIPPKPQILDFVYSEMQRKTPDLNAIASRIRDDGSLFSSVLRLINSPYFGIRHEVQSISQAIALIGLDNLALNIAGIKMRSALKNEGFISMPRYWDTATEAARLASRIASTLGATSSQEAYALGLFKDAGIPILAKRFVGYKDILHYQNTTDQPVFTGREDRLLKTNHCVVGFLMMKKWGMQKSLREACLYHHDIPYITGEFPNDDPKVRRLIVVSKLAEHIALERRGEPDFEWPRIGNGVRDCLGLTPGDMDSLLEELAAETL